ncbi:MAG TPA: MFS transporter [Terracidiphilus sp.]|jgi:sugar (glycoside-pentoside-hexuronide) transporter
MRQTLTFGEKFGYSLGDLAANFIFQAMLALQLDFYTHTFGLTAAQAGTLFLVVGLGVACLNPIMGIIADRTSTRWGKFRPWLLWSALPFGIIGVLTFTTPNISPAGKIIYAWTTYILLRVIYTVNNVPYASITAVMTLDPDERTSISSYRQIAANSAGFIIASLAIPMVRFFGHGDDARGYQYTMGLLSLLSVIFFVIAFFATKERIQPDPQQKTSLGQDLSDLLKNRPWVLLFLATLFYFAAIVIRGNVMLPYFRFVANNVDLFSWFNGFGLVSLLIGVACSTAVSMRMGKRQIFVVSMLLTGVLNAALLIIPPHATILIIGTEVLRQFAYGLSGPIIWSMMGDVADYGEWKTGRRASGTVTAAVVFALWAGLAIGGAVAGWLFSLYGFVSDAQFQTAQAQSGILLTASVYAALAFLASALCMFFYPISRDMNRKIADELVARRNNSSVS